MAAQIACFLNKHGFCKFLDKCKNYHENKNCEIINCEIRECPLRHPKICKYFRDYGYCKFGEWCRFHHKIYKDASENRNEVKELEDKLKIVEDDLEKNANKVLKLESELQDLHHSFKEKDQIVSKINKKFNCLKEKVTLLFDLESRLDTLEKKVEKTNVETVIEKDSEKDLEKDSNPQHNSECTKEIKCDLCDFVAKNKFGLKIHFHKKHSTAKFKCFTCDYTCESHSELVEHSDKYYYSHRRALNKDHEKYILDEFQQLDEDGFLIHRKLDW